MFEVIRGKSAIALGKHVIMHLWNVVGTKQYFVLKLNYTMGQATVFLSVHFIISITVIVCSYIIYRQNNTTITH